MTGLRVSELAARAGVPPSTVRFYERTGLLSPARRAANGYRVFDEAAAGELSLIARAKGIGMSLGDIAEVLAAWRDGSCAFLRERLRAHLAAQVTQTRGQIASLEAFQRRIRSALTRLTSAGPAPDRCGDGCGCASGLEPDPELASEAAAVLPGCSLDHGDLAVRLSDWQALADTSISARRDGDTLRLILDPAAIPAAARLLAAEAACCTQARFTLDVSAGQVTLTAAVPGLSAALPPD